MNGLILIIGVFIAALGTVALDLFFAHFFAED